MPDTGSSTYFRRTSLFWMAVITGSFGCWCFGRRVYHTRVWVPGAASPSTWWTTITPTCTLDTGLHGLFTLLKHCTASNSAVTKASQT
ncbi:transmembrane protein 254 isoform X3 [Scyliorhinus canicula]|uniref:transmembrane protein 254 isoform X3 n=1 Tax=Scyliorhinus canicula TaxID=7830 RepID=UPI0018F69A5B|nr:transmembrane protein 254 isoform X3 [Scyliorhinus canicula]